MKDFGNLSPMQSIAMEYFTRTAGRFSTDVITFRITPLAGRRNFAKMGPEDLPAFLGKSNAVFQGKIASKEVPCIIRLPFSG